MTEIVRVNTSEPVKRISLKDLMLTTDENNKEKPANINTEYKLEDIFNQSLKNKSKDNKPVKVIDFVNKNLSPEKTEKNLFTSSISDHINGYQKPKTVELAEGVTYKEYISNNNSPTETIRAVNISPEKLSKLNVDFSRSSSLNFNDIAKNSNTLVVMNGTFMTSTDASGRPAGDIVGKEFGKVPAKDISKGEKSGKFTISENTVISNIEKRYSFAIDKNNKATIFRGGIDNPAIKPDSNHSADNYNFSLGGGVLLFDKSSSSGKILFNQVKPSNDDKFNSEYLKNNDSRITGKGQGGEPSRIAPRSAMGIMPDGSVVMVNSSEGKYRRTNGAGTTPYELAKIMKDMGCISAVMFDGGGAPVMIAKDKNGKTITHTTPHESGGYGNNKSMIILNK